jgi:uncharacterized tellurite resistance protein B-like protein
VIEALRSFFAKHAQPPPRGVAGDDHALRVAACALLLELAWSDDDFSAAERVHVEEAITRHFGLDQSQASSLIALAEAERKEATDLHQFTSLINRHYDEGQRMVLAEVFWRIVLADGQLVEREAMLARKLASLLELRPGFLAEARKRALGGGGD